MAKGSPKARRARGRPRLTDEQARVEAIRQHLAGRKLERIANSIMRPAAVVLDWVRSIDLKDVAALGREKLSAIFIMSLDVSLELTKEPTTRFVLDDGAVADMSPGETPRQRLERLGAATHARANALAAWKVLQEIEAARRRETPPEPTAEPEVEGEEAT